MTHNHSDIDRLTFGCQGCIDLAEVARWANAPIRHCTWRCNFTYAGRDYRQSFALDVRVPDGVTWQQIDEKYIDLAGEAFVMALPEDVVPMDGTVKACESMDVHSVVVGPIVGDTEYEQESLL